MRIRAMDSVCLGSMKAGQDRTRFAWPSAIRVARHKKLMWPLLKINSISDKFFCALQPFVALFPSIMAFLFQTKAGILTIT